MVLFLSKFLEDSIKLRRYLSEPAMTLLLGIFFSLIVRLLNEADYEEYEQHYEEEYNNNADNANYQDFDEDAFADQYMGDLPQFFLFFPNNIFFMALLPPILFNSGYQLQRELFYRHFSPIALYSCLGTCVAAAGSGAFLIAMKRLGLMGAFDPSNLELMTFGALIAATDTVSVVGVLQRMRVDPHLFSLVFGEVRTVGRTTLCQQGSCCCCCCCCSTSSRTTHHFYFHPVRLERCRGNCSIQDVGRIFDAIS